MRHELSLKGMGQLRTLAGIFGSFVESLAKSVSKLALSVEDQTKQMEKCRKDKH